ALGTRHVEQHLRADDVGENERTRAHDAAIDVSLGGEVDDLGDAVLVEDGGNQIAVADVALDEGEALLVAEEIFEIGEISGVGELVEGDELDLLLPLHEEADEVGPDA